MPLATLSTVVAHALVAPGCQAPFLIVSGVGFYSGKRFEHRPTLPAKWDATPKTAKRAARGAALIF
jgi:hypothetical protein